MVHCFVNVWVLTRPTCFTQYFWWIPNFVPQSRNLQIVGVAALCWAIWKLRNTACFDKKMVRSADEFICYVCSFMQYSAGLQTDEDRPMLERGAGMLHNVALEVHDGDNAGPRGDILMPEAGEVANDGVTEARNDVDKEEDAPDAFLKEVGRFGMHLCMCANVGILIYPI